MADLDFIPVQNSDTCSFISPNENSQASVYKIIIFDETQSFYATVKTALSEYSHIKKPIIPFYASKPEEARVILKEQSDIALVFIPVNTETQNKKYDQTNKYNFIHWVRTTFLNYPIQIVIHQAEPGDFSPAQMIEKYDIDACYIEKNITPQLFQSIVSIAMKSYTDKTKLFNQIKHFQKNTTTLKKKEIILKDVIGNVKDILWEINKDMVYIYISRTVEHQTGLPRSNYLNEHLSFNLTDDALQETWPLLLKKIESRQTFTNIGISRKTKTGKTQYFLTSGNPVYNEKKQFQGYRGADINITDLKSTQFEKEKLTKQLRQAQRLEAVGTLAGGIAHDFNNILGGILGYAQLMQFELKEDQTALAYAKQIVEGCDRAKNLILQILDFSRQSEDISSQKITNPIEIVNETIKLLKASLPSSIKIQSHIDPETGCIRSDPSQIHQAVMNLCTNAGQAIEGGMGEVSIEVKNILFSQNNPIKNLDTDLPFGEYICISVADTGKGIETDALDKIFNPYFTTKAKGDGTGLGLAVVHGIVTRFNGAVTTQTTPGKGTIFTLYFPKYVPKQKQVSKEKNVMIKGDARVLFIDDEPVLVKLGKQMLEKLGYTASATASAIDALSLIKKEPNRFDLVITDMTMPDIHGTQLALKIKKVNQQIPIVLATGFTNLNQSEHPNPDSIDAILPKPIEINTLSQTISQVLSATQG